MKKVTIFITTIIFIFVLSSCHLNESYSIKTIQTDIIVNDVYNEQSLARFVCDKLPDYCVFEELKEIELLLDGVNSINEKSGHLTFSFSHYIDENREGGNISAIKVKIDMKRNKIYEYELFNGASKAYSVATDSLNLNNWSLSISDVLESFISSHKEEIYFEIHNPKIKISVVKDKAQIMLFGEEKRSYISTETYDLITTKP